VEKIVKGGVLSDVNTLHRGMKHEVEGWYMRVTEFSELMTSYEEETVPVPL
jgi:hypothetical protein